MNCVRSNTGNWTETQHGKAYSPCVDGGRISNVVHGRFPRMKPRMKFVIVRLELHKSGIFIRAVQVWRLPHSAVHLRVHRSQLSLRSIRERPALEITPHPVYSSPIFDLFVKRKKYPMRFTVHRADLPLRRLHCDKSSSCRDHRRSPGSNRIESIGMGLRLFPTRRN